LLNDGGDCLNLAEKTMTARAVIHTFSQDLVGVFGAFFEMKKPKQKARQRRRKPNASRLKRQSNKVLDLRRKAKTVQSLPRP
jgi:hypothetical protein